MKDAFLVVGGDSLVGGSLYQALERRGHVTYASTRRRASVGGRRVFLDFEDPAPPRLPNEVRSAVVVAAATNYDRCERDPLAYRINVEYIPRTVAALLEQGLFVSFISTNSVFGGERPWANEEDPHEPTTAYARQKHEGEKAIVEAAERLQARERLSVVRLTKIMAVSTPPLPSWLSAWQRGEAIQPFTDLIFAPLSVQFVGEALASLVEKRIAGPLHLSGAENVSYLDFARELALRLRIAEELIQPATATEKGVHIAFKPRYSALGMKRTTALSGIRPQPLAEVTRDLTT